jgi:hypothetical protein
LVKLTGCSERHLIPYNQEIDEICLKLNDWEIQLGELRNRKSFVLARLPVRSILDHITIISKQEATN